MRNTFNAFRDLSSDYISDLAQSRLGVEPAKLSDIAIDREVWQVLLELQLPRLSSEEKRARRWTKGFTKVNEDERRDLPADIYYI